MNKLERIKKLFKNSKVQPKKKFSDMDNWDSMMYMKFLIDLEKEFKIKINSKDLGKIKSVNSTLKILKKYEKK